MQSLFQETMFKQEIQELNDPRGQNVVNQPSGIRVRDPSQMFVFGDTNKVQGFSNLLADSHSQSPFQEFQESASLLTKNKSQQAGVFSKPFIGNQSSGSGNKSLPNKDANLFARNGNSLGFCSIAVAEASSSDENQPNFGPGPGPGQSQRPSVNYFGPLRIGQQGSFKKPSQSPKSVNNQLSKLVSVKKEDGQRWSTKPASIWLGSHVQQSEQKPSVTGSFNLPSTSYGANKRIRKRSNTRSVESKKRKLSTLERPPCHKKAIEGSSRILDISTAEVEWAQSVVRVPEKLKEVGVELEDSPSIINRKQRLSLTTQLMQMLFQPPPAFVLSENAVAHCDIVTYYASKLALGRSCTLFAPARKNMTSKSNSDPDLLKVIEEFIDRSKRVEDDILRLEKKKPLILEVKMDFQDLEKFSFINRLAKFHSRKPVVTSDSSSSAKPKLRPQRYVRAIPMPEMVPEGQNCLFL